MTILSALIIAKNEQRHIADCLRSVDFVDEVIVIDDNSDDDTVSIAKDMGAKVFTRAMNGNFAEQQNFAIAQATGEWLLFIDCDERITPELAQEIQTAVKGEAIAYWIRRFNYFAKQRVRYGVLRADSVCRLVPAKEVHLIGHVHPHLQHPYPNQNMQHGMLHYTYDSWTQYYGKFEQYTRLSAEKYAEQGKTARFFRDIVLRPVWAFLKMYVIHGGFLDGKIGWILAVNHYHYTMAKYVRLYTLQQYGKDSL